MKALVKTDGEKLFFLLKHLILSQHYLCRVKQEERHDILCIVMNHGVLFIIQLTSASASTSSCCRDRWFCCSHHRWLSWSDLPNSRPRTWWWLCWGRKWPGRSWRRSAAPRAALDLAPLGFREIDHIMQIVTAFNVLSHQSSNCGSLQSSISLTQ